MYLPVPGTESSVFLGVTKDECLMEGVHFYAKITCHFAMKN